MSIPEELSLRLLKPGDSLTGLSLGDERFKLLKSFLRYQASKFHSHNIARTYVLVPNAHRACKVWGYITLLCSEIEIKNSDVKLDDCEEACVYPALPAVKLARLAVDRRVQGNGFGEAMMNFAISLSRDVIMPSIGCRFLVVDAKQYAVKYYEKKGFTILNTEENKQSDSPVLYIDLHRI